MKKEKLTFLAFISGVVTFGMLAYAQKASKDIITPEEARQYFSPITQDIIDSPQNPVTPAKAELGKMLFHDAGLSKTGNMSCNTCHNLANYGVLNIPKEIGNKGQVGIYNIPTVYNVGFNTVILWEVRFKSVEEQANRPILNPIQGAMPNGEAVVRLLESMSGYRELFAKAFPNEEKPITFENVGKAIAAFERTLITPSRFDKFLMGDTRALTAEEKKGLKLFIEKGCVSCHNGVGVGGGMAQKMGIVKPYNSTSPSKGKYDVTKNPEDMYIFKVPSLRNVERTAPYFHDGQVWSLEEAVRIMADIQLGVQLKDDEVKAIVAFLKSLTGEIPRHALTLPVLPPSTDKTPRPSID